LSELLKWDNIFEFVCFNTKEVSETISLNIASDQGGLGVEER